MIFPEALADADEFERFKQAVDAPVLANMTEFGKTELLDVEHAGLGRREHRDLPGYAVTPGHGCCRARVT